MGFLAALFVASTLVTPIPERGSFRCPVAVEPDGADIAVYLDTNHDGSVDQRFRLQREGIGSIQEKSFPSALVTFEPGYLRVLAGDDAFEFVVPGALGDGWDPRGRRVWRYTGYGLAWTESGETGVAIARPGREKTITATFCDASSDCDADGSSGDGNTGTTTGGSGTTLCDSGGPGSTSCSTSGTGGTCSTTCATGYYACCIQATPPKCRCIRG